MRIFITGGTGKLGKHVVELLRKDHEVKVLTRGKTIKGVKTVKGDIFKFNYKELYEYDWVIHLAGSVNFRDPNMYYTNAEGTKAVIERANEGGVKNFLYISSISVYGKKDFDKVTENTPPNPDTTYARSKYAGELYTKEFEGDVVILRPSMIFGEGFYDGFKQVYKLIKKRQMPIIGRGDNVIPLVSAEDVAGAIKWTVENNLEGIYNISNPKKLTQEQLIHLVANEIGVKYNPIHIPRGLILTLVKGLNSIGVNKIPAEYIEMISKNRPINTNKLVKTGFKYGDLKEQLREYTKKLKDMF